MAKGDPMTRPQALAALQVAANSASSIAHSLGHEAWQMQAGKRPFEMSRLKKLFSLLAMDHDSVIMMIRELELQIDNGDG